MKRPIQRSQTPDGGDMVEIVQLKQVVVPAEKQRHVVARAELVLAHGHAHARNTYTWLVCVDGLSEVVEPIVFDEKPRGRECCAVPTSERARASAGVAHVGTEQAYAVAVARGSRSAAVAEVGRGRANEDTRAKVIVDGARIDCDIAAPPDTQAYAHAAGEIHPQKADVVGANYPHHRRHGTVARDAARHAPDWARWHQPRRAQHRTHRRDAL